MLTQINQSHLATLDDLLQTMSRTQDNLIDSLTAVRAELARVTAQRDALRDAAQFASDFYQRNFDSMPVDYQSVDDSIGAALQACQD